MREDQVCAPNYELKENSCIPHNMLVKLAKDFNKQSNTTKINYNTNKTELLNNFYQIYKCDDDDICLLNKINKKLVKKIVRPLGPPGREWLSTTHINEVLSQYEEKYKNFWHLGAVPRDAARDELNYPILNSTTYLNNLNIKELKKKNKTKFSLIYNLDEHWQSGSHWVAVWCNLETCEIYFFDSYGTRPQKDIRDFVRKCANLCYHNKYTKCESNCKIHNESDSFMMHNQKNELEKKLKVNFNRNRWQYKNSECGVYSIYVIQELLKGADFNSFIKKKIPDDVIYRERGKLFRNRAKDFI